MNYKAYLNSHFISFFQTETSSETKLHMLLVESRKMADNLSNQKSAPDELMQVWYSAFFVHQVGGEHLKKKKKSLKLD